MKIRDSRSLRHPVPSSLSRMIVLLFPYYNLLFQKWLFLSFENDCSSLSISPSSLSTSQSSLWNKGRSTVWKWLFCSFKNDCSSLSISQSSLWNRGRRSLFVCHNLPDLILHHNTNGHFEIRDAVTSENDCSALSKMIVLLFPYHNLPSLVPHYNTNGHFEYVLRFPYSISLFISQSSLSIWGGYN